MASLLLIISLWWVRLSRWILETIVRIVGLILLGKKRGQIPAIKDPLLLLPATKLAEKIRNQEVTSEAVVRAYVERLRRVQPLLNAVVDQRYAEALKEARAVDSLVKGTPSDGLNQLAVEKPFLGVPVTIKNSIGVKGLAFDVGLVCREGIKADEDADSVLLVKRAGAIVVALSNVPELCMWYDSHNKLHGRTNNPYDLNRIPGGSSGGECALLASAASVIGLGNDVGGSLRFPSFFCGVYGHKPTPGVVSCNGMFPEPVNQLQKYAVIGPLSRFAVDLRPLLRVIAGDNVHTLKLDQKVDLKKVRFLYVLDMGNPLVTPVSIEIKLAMKKAFDHLRNVHGCTVEPIHVPLLKHSFVIWLVMMRLMEVPTFARYMTNLKGQASIPHEIWKWIRSRPEHTNPILIFALVEALAPPKYSKLYSRYVRMFKELEAQFQEMLRGDTVLLMPTFPEAAPFHHETVFKAMNASYPFLANLMGMPATQCPLGLGIASRLPVGMQAMAGPFNDHLTIAVAEEMDKVFGGWVSPCNVDGNFRRPSQAPSA